MGKKITDMIGRKYGRFTVIQETNERDSSGSVIYVCKCECGNIRKLSTRILNDGQTVSCGCYKRDVKSKFGNSVYKEHLYGVWINVKCRCYNKNEKCYHNYGGRGITMCDEWRNNYLLFKKWALEHGYKHGLWLDRINNDLGYSPDNCRWTTPKEQQRNKRTNIIVEYKGEKMCLKDASEKSGINYGTLRRRIELNWNNDRLFDRVDTKYSNGEKIKQYYRHKSQNSIITN